VANYDTRDHGTGKTITTVYTLGGADKDNYDKPVNDVVTDGVINKLLLTVTAPTLTKTKTYDGNTSAAVTAGTLQNVVSPDVVTVSAVANYDNKNQGTGKTITTVYTLGGADKDNYDKPVNYVVNDGVINRLSLTVNAVTDTKVYNGTVSSTASPLVGTLVSGDVVNVPPIQVYDNRNVGNSHVLYASGLTIKDGANANMTGNYDITYLPSPATGVINVRPITVTAITNTKVYDGNTSALAVPTYPAFQTGDVLGTAPIEVYDNPLAGTGKTMTASGLVINDGNGGLNYNISYVQNFTGVITQASTSTNLITSAASVRYMDPLTMTAQITPLNTATPLTGSVEFKVGTHSYGSVPVVPIPGDPNGAVQATIIPQISDLPANYTVTAIFTSTNNNYSGSQNNKPLTVVARTASPYVGTGFFTGDLFAWTTGQNTSTATVTLAAAIKDLNIPNGDVRGAKVTFYLVNGTSLSPIPSAQNLPVGLVDINDGTIGVASAIVQMNIGSNNAQSFHVAVGISGGYTNNPWHALSQCIVTVSKPIAGGYIVGGGEVSNGNNPNSNGYIKGHNTLTTGFEFDIQYTKSGTNPKGKVNILVRSYYKPDGTLDADLHTYSITTNAIALLNVGTPQATGTFSAKANLVEILQNGTNVAIEGGSTFQMKVFQNGCNQKIAITLHRKAGGIWFSSSWNTVTATTDLQCVTANSRVYVSGGGTCSSGVVNCGTVLSSAEITQNQVMETAPEVLPFNVKAYPNPTEHQFTLALEGGSNEKVQITVYDAVGRQVKKIERNDNVSVIRFGEDLKVGAYIVEVRQGMNRKTLKLLKQ
jgi:hypothetical protein